MMNVITITQKLFTGALMGALLMSASCGSNKGVNKQETQAEAERVESTALQGETNEARGENSEATVSEEQALWAEYSPDDLPDLERRIDPTSYTVWICQYDLLISSLKELPTEIVLPAKEGLQNYKLENASTMSPELAAKFPQIKSMKGVSEEGWSARVDTNEEGLFAEFKQNGEVYVLSPLLAGSKTYYALYNKNDLDKQPRDDDFEKN